MKNPTDHDRLLDDLIEEAMPPGFRAQALARTMAAVRHQRRRRLAVTFAGPLVVFAVTAWLWQARERPALPPTAPAYTVITSQPLAPGQMVHTDPQSVVRLSSAPGNIGWITDRPEDQLVKVLDDEALLTLLADRGAVLVHLSRDQTTLVLANPADLRGFPVP
jgi:hypothetical protein